MIIVEYIRSKRVNIKNVQSVKELGDLLEMNIRRFADEPAINRLFLLPAISCFMPDANVY